MWYIKAIVTPVMILTLALPVYAEVATAYIEPAKLPTITQSSTKDSVKPPSSVIVVKKSEDYISFSDWLNERDCCLEIDTEAEKQKTREQWEKAIGMDIFYPYFKVREIKIKTENKTKIKFFKLRGKARLEEDEAKFIFSVKF